MSTSIISGGEIVEVYKFKRQIDASIKCYIDEINTLGLGRTVLSCQGHFVRRKMKCPFIYYKVDKNVCIATVINSQIRPTYVIYKFFTQSIRNNFLKFFFGNCQDFFNKFRVYIISADMLERVNYIIYPMSIVLCYFDDYFILVSLFYGIHSNHNFKKTRLEHNQYIKKIRDEFFKALILLLNVFDFEKNIVSDNFNFPNKGIYYIFNDRTRLSYIDKMF